MGQRRKTRGNRYLLAVREPTAVVADGRRVPFPAGAVEVGGMRITAEIEDPGDPDGGLVVRLSVRNTGHEPLPVDRVGVVVPGPVARLLENGWQSWSGVRVADPSDVRPVRADAPGWLRHMYLADGDGAGRVLASDQFAVSDAGVVGFLDGRRHLSTVVATDADMTAWALFDGVALGPGEERPLDPLWIADGDPGTGYSRYAARWGAEAGARASAAAPVGWCSWYHYFSDVTPADVAANTALAASHGFGLVQIDDGWQAAVGDWLATRESWSQGTAAAAAAIRDAGPAAGIWTAPFVAAEHSALAADHPDWLLRRPDGLPVRAMYNPDHWGGWALALDTTHPGLLDHLTRTFAALRDQGFDYHKIDFLYAAALPGRRADPAATRAEALRRGLAAVRAGIGDDAFLLGCGCPLAQAVGLVDAMRVSCDVRPGWEPELSIPGFEESGTSLRAALVASALRAPLHRRLWINDADCLLLRPAATGLAPWQRRLQAAAVAGLGGFAVVSDDLTLYTGTEWALLDAVRSVLPGADGPLDIADPLGPALTVRSATTELALAIGPGAGPGAAGGDAAGPVPGAGGRVVLAASGPGAAAVLRRR